MTAPIAEIRGDSHERLLRAVVSLAREIGYRVTFGDSGRAEGTCNRQTRPITIAERLAPNGRLAAAIHELAHALVGEDAAAPKLTYAQEELVVESSDRRLRHHRQQHLVSHQLGAERQPGDP